MKRKVVGMLLSGIMAASILTGCSTSPEPKEETKQEEPADTTEDNTAEDETANSDEADDSAEAETDDTADTQAPAGDVALPADGKLKTGQGVYSKISSSKAATAEEAGTAQVDSAIATVTYDSKGVIVKCVIDAAQTKVNFTDKGEIETDLGTEQKTKVEAGSDYGMKNASAIGKEWDEQIKAFADWTVGKTLDEVKGLQVKKVDDSHPMVPDVPELTSSVSISVGDYIEVIEKAMTSDGVEFDTPDSYTTGLGVITSIGSSKPAADGEEGTGQVDSAVVSVTLDGEGKIVACVMDAAQTKVAFNDKGEITSDLNGDIQTKVELGSNYGMKNASSIGKEWDEQIKAFADWTIGKTLDEVKGLQVKKVDDSHPMVPDVAELTSSVSISVGDYLDGVEKAVSNAQ